MANDGTGDPRLNSVAGNVYGQMEQQRQANLSAEADARQQAQSVSNDSATAADVDGARAPTAPIERNGADPTQESPQTGTEPENESSAVTEYSDPDPVLCAVCKFDLTDGTNPWAQCGVCGQVTCKAHLEEHHAKTDCGKPKVKPAETFEAQNKLSTAPISTQPEPESASCQICGGSETVSIIRHADGQPETFACPVCAHPQTAQEVTHEEGELGRRWRLRVFEAEGAVDEAEERMHQAEKAVDDAKGNAKYAEREFDRCVDELREAIKGKAQGVLEFPDKRTPAEQVRESAPPVAEESAQPQPEITHGEPEPEADREKPITGEMRVVAEDDESWRAFPVGDLNIPPTLATRLEEAGLKTVGEISEFTESGGSLRDIKGLGPAKLEKLETGLEQFWAKRKTEQQRPPIFADAGEPPVAPPAPKPF